MEIARWIIAVKVCGKAVSRGVTVPIEPLLLAIIGLTPELGPCSIPLGGSWQA